MDCPFKGLVKWEGYLHGKRKTDEERKEGRHFKRNHCSRLRKCTELDSTGSIRPYIDQASCGADNKVKQCRKYSALFVTVQISIYNINIT